MKPKSAFIFLFKNYISYNDFISILPIIYLFFFYSPFVMTTKTWPKASLFYSPTKKKMT